MSTALSSGPPPGFPPHPLGVSHTAPKPAEQTRPGPHNESAESARALRMCLNLTWACHDMYDTEGQKMGPLQFLNQFLVAHEGLYPTGCQVLVSDFKQFQYPEAGRPVLHPFLALLNVEQKFAILAFRPTVSNTSWKDVFTDLQGYANHADYEGSRHAGFTKRAESVPVYAALDWLKEGYRVYITGHSLGGAVAQLFTCRMIQMLVLNGAVPDHYTSRLRCITFGTPNAADATFWSAFKPWVDVFHTYIFRYDGVFRLAIGTVDTILKAVESFSKALSKVTTGFKLFLSGEATSSDLSAPGNAAAAVMLHPKGSMMNWVVPDFALFGSYHFLQVESHQYGVPSVVTLGGRAVNGEELELDRLLGIDVQSMRKEASQRALEFLEQRQVLGPASRSATITLRDLKDHGCYPHHVNQLVAALHPSINSGVTSAVPSVASLTDKAMIAWGLSRVTVVAKAHFYSICFSGLLAGFVTSVYPPHELWSRNEALKAAPYGTSSTHPASRTSSPSYHSAVYSATEQKPRPSPGYPKPLVMASSVEVGAGSPSALAAQPSSSPPRAELWPTVAGSSECNHRAIYAIALPSTQKTHTFLQKSSSDFFTASFNTCLGPLRVDVTNSVHPLDDELSLQHEPIEVLFVCYWELLLSDTALKQLAAPMSALLQAVDGFGEFSDFQTGPLDTLFAQFFAKRHASRVNSDPHKYFLAFLEDRLPSKEDLIEQALGTELQVLYDLAKKRRSTHSAAPAHTKPGDFVPTTDDGSDEAASDQAGELHEFLSCALWEDFHDVFGRLSKYKKYGLVAPSDDVLRKYHDERLKRPNDSILDFKNVLDDLSRFRTSQLPDEVRQHFAFSIVPMYAMAIKFRRLQMRVKSLSDPPSTYAQSLGHAMLRGVSANMPPAPRPPSATPPLAQRQSAPPFSEATELPHPQVACRSSHW